MSTAMKETILQNALNVALISTDGPVSGAAVWSLSLLVVLSSHFNFYVYLRISSLISTNSYHTSSSLFTMHLHTSSLVVSRSADAIITERMKSRNPHHIPRVLGLHLVKKRRTCILGSLRA
ncbi:hypothetical protein PILCRDRAFT_309452 [Piloderma croceum F 1598]|uniref:Uncharacterized protein n=1 Tax=Piloderma croceum (strain F 1598) TaxID=765440 RepID=A0A0C3G7I7_PILCF|nr:hypothetical protein PILCRDRAFT_309452 [Piloderma croceum F 1598]